MPRITVPRDNPLALATAVTPPKPRASASAAATKRRVRSFRTRARTSNLCAKPPASGMSCSIEHFHSTCSIYFVTPPKFRIASAKRVVETEYSMAFGNPVTGGEQPARGHLRPPPFKAFHWQQATVWLPLCAPAGRRSETQGTGARRDPLGPYPGTRIRRRVSPRDPADYGRQQWQELP